MQSQVWFHMQSQTKNSNLLSNLNVPIIRKQPGKSQMSNIYPVEMMRYASRWIWNLNLISICYSPFLSRIAGLKMPKKEKRDPPFLQDLSLGVLAKAQDSCSWWKLSKFRSKCPFQRVIAPIHNCRHSFQDQQTQLQNWLQFCNKKLPLAPNSSLFWMNGYNFVPNFGQLSPPSISTQKGNLRPSLLDSKNLSTPSTLICYKKSANILFFSGQLWKLCWLFIFSLKECSSLWASVGLLSLVSCSPAPQQKIFAKLTLLHQKEEKFHRNKISLQS